jgi:hypothetical protein
MGHPVVEAEKRVINRQAGVSAQTEYVPDSVKLEHADEGFGPGELVHGIAFV